MIDFYDICDKRVGSTGLCDVFEINKLEVMVFKTFFVINELEVLVSIAFLRSTYNKY